MVRTFTVRSIGTIAWCRVCRRQRGVKVPLNKDRRADVFLCERTSLKLLIISRDSSMSLNIPSSLLVKLGPHSV